MSADNIPPYKKQLLQKCIDIINELMTATTMAMENAQSAANSEEKSSAGDKYETSRAMSHIEKDMYAVQLAASQKELFNLMSIDYASASNIIIVGSLVACGEISFFIAAGIGLLTIAGKKTYVLSPAAPLAKSLLGKKPGDKITFNKTELEVSFIS